LETRYRADINKWNAYNTQLHYATTCSFHILNCASYYDTTVLTADFWIYLFACLNALFFFLNGIINPYGRRHRVGVHIVFCLMNLWIASALACVQSKIWTARTLEFWLPNGSHLQLSGPDSVSQPMDVAFERLLQSLDFKLATFSSFTMVQVLLWNLAIAGLNPWSVLSYLIFLVCLVARTASYGGFPFVFMGLMYTQSVAGYVALAVLLERVQRQKFMAETLLSEQMHAGEMADNILNHTLKNTLADVAGYIELFLTGSAPVEVLNDGVACLRRGMKACRDRHAYLKLVAGMYSPVLSTVGLRELGQELLGGRPASEQILDLTVLIDRTLITLILDTALSNAVKHGRPGDPDVTLTIRRTDAVGPFEPPGNACVEFLVSNAADPHRPPLSPHDATSLFVPTPSHPLRRVPVISDGIGLAGSLVAAQTAGFDISLSQEGNRVCFRVVATLPLAELRCVPDSPDSSAQMALVSSSTVNMDATLTMADPFPSHLHFFIMDDAAMSRRIMENHIRRHCLSATVHAYGAEESDVELFPAVAAEQADIVVIDQHLDYKETHLGTNVVRRLLLMGYRGLVCVRSSDGSPADLQLYAAAGAHLYIGKDVGGDEVMRRLKTAYLEHRGQEGQSSQPLGP